MGDPARRNDDNADDDEFFSPAAFVAPAPADDEFNAPEAFKAAAPVGPPRGNPDEPPPAVEKPGLLEQFVEGGKKVGNDIYEGAQDAYTAAKPYLTPNGLAGTWANVMDSELLGGRGKGLRDDPDQQALQSDVAAAQQRSPAAAGAAQMLGALPMAETLGASGLGSVGTGAGVGAVDSYAHGGSDRDAVLSAFLGGGTAGAMKGLGATAEALNDPGLAAGLEKQASRNRVAAAGIYGGAYKKLANEIGTEGITKLGNDIEQRGLHRGSGKLGFLPQSAETYLDNADELVRGAGDAQRGIASQAGERGVQVPLDNVLGQLDQQAGVADSRWSPAGSTQADFMRDNAQRIRQGAQRVSQNVEQGGDTRDAAYMLSHPDNASQEMSTQHAAPFEDALGQRQYYDQQIAYGAKNPGQRIPHQDATNRFVANDLRGGLQSSLDEQAPDLAGPWQDRNRDLSVGLSVKYPAESRVYQEAGNQKMSLPALLAAASGTAAGGPAGGLGAMLATGAVKSRGAAASAGMLRGMQHTVENYQSPDALGAGGVDMLSQFLQSTPAAGVAGEIGSNNNPTQQRERLKQAATDGNGGELPDTINRILQDPQQAPMLGKYRAQFEQAGRTPDGMRALLAKLEQDTQWRTGIKPQLLSMTGDR